MNPPRCGNCGRFGGVRYEWRGPSYCEVFDCPNCGPKGYEYDAFAAALEDMSEDEIRELATDGGVSGNVEVSDT